MREGGREGGRGGGGEERGEERKRRGAGEGGKQTSNLFATSSRQEVNLTSN